MKFANSILLYISALAGLASIASARQTSTLLACEYICGNYVITVNSTAGCLTAASSSGKSSRKLEKRKKSGATTELDYECACTDDVYQGSWALCIDKCAENQKEKTWNYWSDLCGNKTNYEVTIDKSYEYYLELAEKDYVVEGQYDGATDVPSMINSTTFDYPYRTQDAYMHNMKDAVIYGNTLLVFWGFFMVLAFLNNVFSRLLNIERGATNKYVTMFRKWFILPATFGKMHAEPFRFFGIALNITPVRWMYLLVVLYSILNVVFLWPQIDIFEENTKLGTPRQQWARYIADRSGIFATVMLPSLYLFAGRNNILQYFSGWQFETFNVIHRWTGRWMFIQSAIHGLTYSLVYVYQDGGYATYVESVWHVEAIIWGSVATILAAAIIFQGFYPFRHYFYEIFKILHIALAAVFLAYTYLHVYAYNYYQWMFYKYLWATVGIWVADHVFRIFRILYSGLFATASVKIVGGAAIIRVKPMISWTPKPGQYAYLYVMRHNFWESHPFSVVGKENGEYLFVAKAETGMTHKLLRSVSKAPDATKSKMNVWVEGFYGESAPVSRFDTILFVAGGIGITAIVSYATALANKAREGQHIILYWILRNETDLGWVKSQIDAIAATRRVEIHIFVTGAHDSSVAALSDVKNNDSASVSATDSEKANSLDGSKISWTADDVTYGQRPDMNAVIASTVHEANGSVAVMMCGPGTLSDVCRQAVAQNVDKGKARVEYFEEVFSWA